MHFVLLFGGVVAMYGLVLSVGAKPLLHSTLTRKYDKHWLLVALFILSMAASTATSMFIISNYVQV